MATVILLLNSDLPKLTAIGGNVDPDRYWHCVRDAQKTEVRDFLGKELYQKMQDLFVSTEGTFSGTSNAIYQQLYQDYLKDYIVHTAAEYYYAIGAYQISDAGIVKTSTENTETVTKEEVDYLVYHQRNMADKYRRQMVEFLEDNKSSIPEFTSKCSSEGDNFFGWFLPNHKRGKGRRY